MPGRSLQCKAAQDARQGRGGGADQPGDGYSLEHKIRTRSNDRKAVEMAGSDRSLDTANDRRRPTKQQALDKTLQILAAKPDASPAEHERSTSRIRITGSC